MIDASDHGRLQEAQEELVEILDDDAMKAVPCLILANKQDRPGALAVNDLAERLNLREIHGRPWHIKVEIIATIITYVLLFANQVYPESKACCARTGEGLQEGFEWLSMTLLRLRRGDMETTSRFKEPEPLQSVETVQRC